MRGGREEEPGEAPPRVLYTLLANPFSGERCCYTGTNDRPQGDMVPAARVLSLHLEALAALPSRLAALIILLPYGDARPPIPGYLDIAAASAEKVGRVRGERQQRKGECHRVHRSAFPPPSPKTSHPIPDLR